MTVVTFTLEEGKEQKSLVNKKKLLWVHGVGRLAIQGRSVSAGSQPCFQQCCLWVSDQEAQILRAEVRWTLETGYLFWVSGGLLLLQLPASPSCFWFLSHPLIRNQVQTPVQGALMDKHCSQWSVWAVQEGLQPSGQRCCWDVWQPGWCREAPALIKAAWKLSPEVCSEQELIKIQKVISLVCPLITGNLGRPDQTQTCRLRPRVMWYKWSCLGGGLFFFNMYFKKCSWLCGQHV